MNEQQTAPAIVSDEERIRHLQHALRRLIFNARQATCTVKGMDDIIVPLQRAIDDAAPLVGWTSDSICTTSHEERERFLDKLASEEQGMLRIKQLIEQAIFRLDHKAHHGFIRQVVDIALAHERGDFEQATSPEETLAPASS
jgi:hypothetical protein